MLLISHLISDRRVARIKKEKGVDQLGGRQKKTEVDETRDRSAPRSQPAHSG